MSVINYIQLAIIGILGYFGYTFIKKTDIVNTAGTAIKDGISAGQDIVQSAAGYVYEYIWSKTSGYIDNPRGNLFVEELFNRYSKTFSASVIITSVEDFSAAHRTLESHAFNIITFKTSFLTFENASKLIQMCTNSRMNFPSFKFRYYDSL
jgi:hypothetical protein